MPRPRSDLHGSAGFSRSTSPLDPLYRTKQGEHFIPLTITQPGSSTGLLWDVTREQGHGACFAVNRTGKGASEIIPALLCYGGSVLVIDPKGENAWVTAPRRRQLGQRTVVLDPFNEVNTKYAEGAAEETITRFNPLRMLNPDLPSFSDDVLELAYANIVPLPGAKDPFFDSTARDFIKGVIAIAVEIFGSEASMIGVRKIMKDAELLASVCEEALRIKPDSLGLEDLRSFITVEYNGDEPIVTVKDDRTTESIIKTALTQTSYLDSAAMRESLQDDSENPFSMEWLWDGRTTVYLVLPPNRLESHSRWLRLCITFALRAVTTAPRKPSIPFLFLLDEMGTIGSLRSLESAFGLLAGYSVRFFGFWQSISQLKNDYPKTWANFIANCSYVQCLSARDPETAQFISEELGTQTWVSDDGEKKDKRPLLLPQEVKAMLGQYPDRLNENLQVTIAKQGGRNYLEYQNPYFMQSGWSGKYRPLPGTSSAPASRAAAVVSTYQAPPASANPFAERGGGMVRVREKSKWDVETPRKSSGLRFNKPLVALAIVLTLLRLGLVLVGADRFRLNTWQGWLEAVIGLWIWLWAAVFVLAVLPLLKGKK